MCECCTAAAAADLGREERAMDKQVKVKQWKSSTRPTLRARKREEDYYQ